MKVILVDAVNTFVIKGEGVFEEMHQLLEQYPNRKIVLTNANDEEQKVFGLDKIQYELFSLSHNPNKTDPLYYKKMLEHFNLSPHDVLYFEHNEAAVKSARSLKINTFHYNPEKRDLKALKHFIDMNIN